MLRELTLGQEGDDHEDPEEEDDLAESGESLEGGNELDEYGLPKALRMGDYDDEEEEQTTSTLPKGFVQSLFQTYNIPQADQDDDEVELGVNFSEDGQELLDDEEEEENRIDPLDSVILVGNSQTNQEYSSRLII